MNKSRFAILIVLILAAAVSYAQVSHYGYAFPGSSGYTIQSSREEAGRIMLHVSGSGGSQYRVDAFVRGSSALSASIVKLMDAIKGWASLSITEAVITVDSDIIRLRVTPNRLMYGGKNYQMYVPSGLLFMVVGDRVEYDFRLKVDAYFIRFQGVFLGESSFMERMAAAVGDPQRYIQDNDPEFLIRRVTELQLDADRAASDRLTLSAQLAAALDRISALETRAAKNEDRALMAEGRIGAVESRSSAAETRLDEAEKRLASGEDRLDSAEERLSVSERRVSSAEARLDSAEARLLNGEGRMTAAEGRLDEAEALAADHEGRLVKGEERLVAGELWLDNHEGRLIAGEERLVIGERRLDEAENRLDQGDSRDAEAAVSASATEAALRALIATKATAQDKIAMAIMAELSKGWFFGQAKAIEPALFERIVSLKTEKPELPVKEMRETLKAEGLKVDDAIIKAVYAVIFGEY